MLLKEAVGHDVRVELVNGQVHEGVIGCQGKKIFSIGDAKDGNDRIFFSSDHQVRFVYFSKRPEIFEIIQYICN